MVNYQEKVFWGLNTMIFTATPKIISSYCGLGAYKEWYVFHAIVNAMMMMGPYGHFPLNSSPYKVVFFLRLYFLGIEIYF